MVATSPVLLMNEVVQGKSIFFPKENFKEKVFNPYRQNNASYNTYSCIGILTNIIFVFQDRSIQFSLV